MGLFNMVFYVAVALYSFALLGIAWLNIFGAIPTANDPIPEGKRIPNDEALLRAGLFAAGMAIFLISFSYVIPVKEIIRQSFVEATGANASSIALSVLCSGGGVLSTIAILSALKKRDARAIRMLLLLIGLLIGAIAYSYSIAFEANTVQGGLNTAFLPSVFFIIGSVLYAGFKYEAPVSVPSLPTQIYACAVSLKKGELFNDKHTGLVYDFVNIVTSSQHAYTSSLYDCYAFGYLTVPEDIATIRMPKNSRTGNGYDFTFKSQKFTFIIERIDAIVGVIDVRVVQKT